MRKLVPPLPEVTDALFVIHLSQGLADLENGTTPEINTIAVESVLTGEQTYFSVPLEIDRQGLNIRDHAGDFIPFERIILSNFWRFVAEHPNTMWLHWGMRRPEFGFPALVNRAQAIQTDPLPTEIPIGQRFDLMHWMKLNYGDNFLPHPYFHHAIRLNNLGGPGLLTPAEATEAWQQQRYGALVRSCGFKVGAIVRMFHLAQEGKFIYEPPSHSEAAIITPAVVPPLPEIPKWEGCRLEFRGQVIKQYTRQSAPNQWAILDAFQREGWPASIPIPQIFDSSATLNATIYNMNKYLRQNNSFQLSLTLDGAIRWETIEPNAKRS
ncbi:hypothetical protein [Tuwongella immobilis]|nr:hypothetical protein [Tuwongella immobilis]